MTSSPSQPTPARLHNRVVILALALGTIVIGLLSRKFPIAGNYPGDALWATLVFFLWILVAPRFPLKVILALALASAFCVEFSQLYQAPWINAVRETLPGRLVLGSGFDPFDLLAYLCGCLLGLFIVRQFTTTSSPQPDIS